MINIIKKYLRPIFKIFNNNNFFRSIMTSNNTSSLIALGEKRNYVTLPHRWIMLDISGADININLSKEDLPFNSNSKNIIYSSHFFEHLAIKDAERLLGECFRILKPSGILRIEVPDFSKVLNLYKNHQYDKLDLLQFTNKKESYHNIVAGVAACFVKDGTHTIDNNSFDKNKFDELLATNDIDLIGDWCIQQLSFEQKQTYGHQSFFYFEKLKNILEKIGFSNINECSFKNSKYKNKIPFERKGREIFSITVECIKL